MIRERLRVLLDTDGVKADYLSTALPILNRMAKTAFTHEDVLSWETTEIYKDLLTPAQLEEYWEIMRSKGICTTFKVLPGAQEGVEKLRGIDGCEIYVVTSPMPRSDTWTSEREKWLWDHFKIPSSRVSHTRAKFLCEGDMLVDDKPEHIRTWAEAHPQGVGVLWSAPYNRKETDIQVPTTPLRRETLHRNNMIRANTWDQVVEQALALLR